MASLRPEGALNSAKGLVEIGRTDDAMEVLHTVLSNRRYRQWNSTMEKIAEEYVRLCLSVGKPRYAKDGLIQFRNICQPNNLHSLDGILRMFRGVAEEKVRETRGKLVAKPDGLIDLEEVESGESLLVTALSPDSAVADERAARTALRDLWDTLRTILEVCRNQAPLDEIYHSTAIMAFDFCSEFKRKSEFRRICETLRLHQQQSSTRPVNAVAAIVSATGGSAASTVSDPILRTIDTRYYQMKVAIELGLWTVAFYCLDEIHVLLSKKRPSIAQMTTFYTALEKVLWVSSNADLHQFFHAACLLKLYTALTAASSDSQQVPSVIAELTAVADATVMSVLTSSVADSLAAAASEHQVYENDGQQVAQSAETGADKSARLSTLVGCTGTPTSQSLLSDLISKDVLSNASQSVRNLYNLLTEDSSSCRRASGWINTQLPQLLSEIRAKSAGKFEHSIRRLALVIVTREMQTMYSKMSFEKFASLTSDILPLEESIKLLGQLKRTDYQIHDVAIDYVGSTISFGSAGKSAGTGSVISFAVINEALFELMQIANRIRRPALEARAVELAGDLIYDEENLANAIEIERKKCFDRKSATETRKENLEKEAVRRANEIADQIQKAEEQRIEADAKARAEEVSRKEYEAKKKEDQLHRAKLIVERMNALGPNEASGLTDEQIAKLGPIKLEQMQKEQFAKERENRIAKRRNEYKRIEHTARMYRSAENDKIAEWAATVFEQDKAFFSQIAADKAEEWKKANESKRNAVNALLPFASVIGGWKNELTEEFNRKLAVKAEERRAALAAKDAAEIAGGSIHNLSRDDFKQLGKSLPNWKEEDQQE